MRGISWFVDILRDRSKLLRLKLTNLFPNINFSGEKDSGKVLIIIIILFLIILIKIYNSHGRWCNSSTRNWKTTTRKPIYSVRDKLYLTAIPLKRNYVKSKVNCKSRRFSKNLKENITTCLNFTGVLNYIYIGPIRACTSACKLKQTPLLRRSFPK